LHLNSGVFSEGWKLYSWYLQLNLCNSSSLKSAAVIVIFRPVQ